MKLIAVPSSRSPFGRTDTGRPAVRLRRGSAFSSFRKRRSAPAQIASTTSFKVTPAFSVIAFSRASSYCWVAKRRWPSTRSLSTDFGALNGVASASLAFLPLQILVSALNTCGTRSICCVSCSRSRSKVDGTAASDSSLTAAFERRFLRSAPIVHGGVIERWFGLVENARAVIRMPPTPSISAWCIFVYSAKRLFSSPSMTWHSQSGRLRSSSWLCRRDTSTPSSRSPPGCGSAEWRTW